MALFNETSLGSQARSLKSGLYGLQRRGINGPDWLKKSGVKLGAKLILVTLVMTWLITSTSWEVTSLLLLEVSWAVALSTQGRMSSKAVWAVGFSTHWFIDTHVSAVTLIQHGDIVSYSGCKFWNLLCDWIITILTNFKTNVLHEMVFGCDSVVWNNSQIIMVWVFGKFELIWIKWQKRAFVNSVEVFKF